MSWREVRREREETDFAVEMVVAFSTSMFA
jgi:hypothetical protein